MKKLDFEQMVFVPLPAMWNIALDGPLPACAQSFLQAFDNTTPPAKEVAKIRKATLAWRPVRF
ncbi:hypothetical protein HNQ50_004428 [Silvimonas terrae]|uniref:Uncharacterized protein n=1 Tax=Silvimonas terrae TaxID=300266 RepID=A0A840RMB6_9NEIS|nr:hypothetical protein [Silvimonas terrae]MBB5193668.1 hypothetical protein [Silvimonas terrae]